MRRLVGPRPNARRLLAPAGHIFVLSAFAVAQPLFYLFSRNAEFFTVRGSSPLDILVFALGILLVPTAVLLAVEGVAALVGERVWYAVHVVFVAALSALILLPVLKRVADQYGPSLLVAAGLVGAGVAFAYVRLSSVRSFLTLLIPAPLIFAGLFLFHSPVSRLVFVDDAPVRSSSVGTRIPVVFVVFDELSTVTLLDGSERINAKRFPNFAALADDATFYRDATTVHDFTEHAVPSILTGRLPAKGELPIYADHRQNLFTLLGKDYRLHVRETLTHLCPVSLCRPTAAEPLEKRLGSLVEDSSIVYLHVILPGALRERLPPVDRSWKSFRGMTVAEEDGKGNPGTLLSCAPVCGLVKDFSLAHPASLYFRHLQSPHIPWRYLPSGKRYLGDTRSIPGLSVEHDWADDEFLTTQAQERYFLQLGYTDRALGIVLDELHETGLYDRALVVVAADHGLSFQPDGPRREITAANAHDIAFMPLFIKLPDQREGRIEDGFVRTVDILPTVADVLHLTIPQPVDGRSLLGRRPAPDGTVVIDGKTARIEEPLSELLRRRAEALRRQVEVFGGEGWSELYKSGPNPELVGRPLSDLDLEDAPGLTVELDGRALLDAYDPDSPLSPAYVLGRIVGASAGLDLAVGVNGRIVATTRTYDSFGDARLAVFVPESSLRRGQNEIDVLAVRPDGGLERIEVAAPPLSLEDGVIRRADGTALRLDADVVRGELGVERSEERFVFTGWAVDLDRRRPVDSVAVFVDGRLVYVARGRTFRTITPQQHEGIAEAGFRFALPRSLMPVRGSAHVVRVFAVSGDTAAELEYGPGYPWEHAAG